MSQLRVLVFTKPLIPNIYAPLYFFFVTATINTLHQGLIFFLIITDTQIGNHIPSASLWEGKASCLLAFNKSHIENETISYFTLVETWNYFYGSCPVKDSSNICGLVTCGNGKRFVFFCKWQTGGWSCFKPRSKLRVNSWNCAAQRFGVRILQDKHPRDDCQGRFPSTTMWAGGRCGEAPARTLWVTNNHQWDVGSSVYNHVFHYKHGKLKSRRVHLLGNIISVKLIDVVSLE